MTKLGLVLWEAIIAVFTGWMGEIFTVWFSVSTEKDNVVPLRVSESRSDCLSDVRPWLNVLTTAPTFDIELMDQLPLPQYSTRNPVFASCSARPRQS